MPSLTFAMPHWLYWAGLVLLPLLAMFLVRRQRDKGPMARTSLPVAYFLLVTGGYIGLHRFYLRSLLGVVYIPLFIAILFGNIEGRASRDELSGARNDISSFEFLIELAQKRLDEGRAGAAEGLAKAERELVGARERYEVATQTFDGWERFSRHFALAILVLLVLDLILLPRLTRRCTERDTPRAKVVEKIEQPEPRPQSATRGVHSRLTDAIDAINGFAGNFVAYWSIIAVFVYYYEVLARYVFNSPTNWAHESMFLMFGMQYLLAGGYALKEESHVRVDVLYLHFSRRGKALADTFSSVFFFIFTGALAWTGWVFFHDSLQMSEVSFTEWAIQYYPVKFAIPLGATLIFLQGLAVLFKDILVLAGKEE